MFELDDNTIETENEILHDTIRNDDKRDAEALRAYEQDDAKRTPDENYDTHQRNIQQEMEETEWAKNKFCPNVLR